VENIGWSFSGFVHIPLSYRTCIKWLIIRGILTVLRVAWSLCCVVCGLIALAGSSPWITESWCVDAGAGGFFMPQFVHYPVWWCHIFTLYVRCMCVSSNSHFMWKSVLLSSCWVFSSFVFVVGCLWLLGWKSACCYVSCKWPCPFVRVLGNVYSQGEGVGQL